MSGIGHNRGPTMEPGGAWRRYAWTRARADLLPKLPLEVVRMRVRRARELGIDYKAYASIRAASGHDVVALLFSSNALRLLGGTEVLPADRAEVLARIRNTGRLGLISGSLRPAEIVRRNSELDGAARAPHFAMSWHETSGVLRAFLREQHLPGDRVLMIGDTAIEREWLTAGNLAGYLSADKYFGAPVRDIRT